VAVLSTVTLLRATIAVIASLTSLSVLTTEAIGRYVSFGIAGTKLGLASSITVTIFATVAFLGTAVAECASLTSLAVLSTETISRDISSIGQSTIAEALLTASTAMLDLVSTPAADRAAIAIAGVQTDLAIRATLAVKGDITRWTTCAKVGSTVVTAVGGRVTTPALSGTTVAKGTATTNELVCATTGTIRRDASRA
jgi:hypothetical protein